MRRPAECIISTHADGTFSYAIGEGDFVEVSTPLMRGILDELNKFRQVKAALK